MYAFDLLIPTSGTMYPLEGLLASLHQQEVLPQRLVLLVRKETTQETLQTFTYAVRKLLDGFDLPIDIVSALTSNHQSGQGVGYDRNFLLQQTTAPYICMIDEDNQLPAAFFSGRIAGYQQVTEKLGCSCIVSPTIMYRDTGYIQSQGITSFSFWLPRYTFGRCGDRPRQEVKMIGANSLFGPREVFQRLGFDDRMIGSYEDIDFSYRATLAGIPVIVLRDVVILHMERKRTYLAEKFLGTPASAYYRSRNRVLFVKKNATFWQKIGYFSIGLRVQTIRFMLLILRYGGDQRWKLWKAVVQGTLHGLYAKKSSA